jgi:uncharacterized membrane protein HdeD (DUF308 family)
VDPLRLLTWLFVLRGLLAIAFGAVALLQPGVTVIALALLFGAFALVDGVGLLVGAFRRGHDSTQRVGHAVAGLAGVALGVLTLIWPGITALALAILIGAWAVVTGLGDIWFTVRDHGQWIIAVVGVLSVIAGILVLVWPGIGAVAIAQVIGAYAIVGGVLMLAAAWRLQRRGRTAGAGRVQPA